MRKGRKMENNNLYVNVNQLFELLECIRQRNPQYWDVIGEVKEVVMDLKWEEIKDEEKRV